MRISVGRGWFAWWLTLQRQPGKQISRRNFVCIKRLGEQIWAPRWGVSGREKVGSLVWVVVQELLALIVWKHAFLIRVNVWVGEQTRSMPVNRHFLMATFAAVLFFLPFYTWCWLKGICFSDGALAVHRCIVIVPSVCSFPQDVPYNLVKLNCWDFLQTVNSFFESR